MTGQPASRRTMLLGGFLLLAIALAVTGTLWLAFRYLQAEVVVSLLVGVLTVGAYLWRRRSEIRENRERRLQEQKIPVYETFLRFWFDILYTGAKSQKAPTAKALDKFVVESVPGFILWASTDVIKTWNEVRKDMGDGGQGEADPSKLFGLEELMRTMRADVGHDVSDLAPGELLALFIKGADLSGLQAPTGQGR